MYKEFLLEHKIPFEQNLKNGSYILFNREIKENTIWSWIQKSRDHGLTSVEIYNTIKYEIPFGRLKEISIEDLDRFNIFNNAKYLYHKKLREYGLLATWKQGEKWEVEAIDYPELGARTLTREAINKHLSLNTPVQYIIKKAPSRVTSDLSITEEEVLEYGLKTPSQKKMYKGLRPYGVHVIFKDNKPDFFKVKISGQVLEVSAHRLRLTRKGLSILPDATPAEVNWLLKEYSFSHEEYDKITLRYCIVHNITHDYVFVFNLVRKLFPFIDVFVHGQDDVEISYQGHSLRGNRLLIRDRVQTWKDWTKVLTPRNQFYSSSFEQDVEEFLRELGIANIQKNVRTLKGVSEIDFLLPDYNIAIECNGVYYHSEKYKSTSFHQDKSLACKANGLHLIHIWEDYWYNKSEIIKSILKAKLRLPDRSKLYARRCTVQAVPYAEAVAFLNANHLNGFSVSKHHFGLYHNNVLVMILSLSNSRKFLKQKDWEIVRLATLRDTYIVGGFSRLLHYVSKTLAIQQLFSFVDFDMHSGTGYDAAGFKLIKLTAPGYFYVHTDLTHRKHRYNFTRQALTKRGYSPDVPVNEIMKQLRYLKVFNSGNLVYVKNF